MPDIDANSSMYKTFHITNGPWEHYLNMDSWNGVNKFDHFCEKIMFHYIGLKQNIYLCLKIYIPFIARGIRFGYVGMMERDQKLTLSSKKFWFKKNNLNFLKKKKHDSQNQGVYFDNIMIELIFKDD